LPVSPKPDPTVRQNPPLCVGLGGSTPWYTVPEDISRLRLGMVTWRGSA
jgi:hypothetical protein